MTIGLYDADRQIYLYLPFNLDLMKMATYYKKRHDIVIMSPHFNPDKYSKFIYRKDYFDDTIFPIFSDYQNLEYGGLVFSGGRHIQLPTEIEQQPADTSIYQTMLSKKTPQDFPYLTVLDGAHIRLSLDGENIWNRVNRQFSFAQNNYKSLIIHDENPSVIYEAPQFIKDALAPINKNRKRLVPFGSKFPIIINNIEDLIKWTEVELISNHCPFEYIGLLNDDEIVGIAERDKKTQNHLMNQFSYNIAATSYEDYDFFIKNLPKIFLQALFLQRQNQKISLTYDNNFFVNPKWSIFFNLFNRYLKLNRIIDETFYEYLRNSMTNKLSSNRPDKEEVVEMFNLIKEESYETFQMFYETGRVIYKGGKLTSDGKGN